MKINQLNVGDLIEKWSNKYKRSIDCEHPRGFSQRAHCAGRKKTNEVAGNTPGEYVYHAAYLPQGLDSVAAQGLLPSKHGYAGPGVYFAYDPNGGFYHVSKEDATLFRVRWTDLVKKFGTYPSNPDGIQRDDKEIIVPGTVPPSMLEVEFFPSEWWKISDAAAANNRSVDENFADGRKPGRKGLAKRMGVDCSQSVTALRKIAANSSGERQRMAHWCANMKAGRNESVVEGQFRSQDVEEFKPNDAELEDIKNRYLPAWDMLDHRFLQAQFVAVDHMQAEQFVVFINRLSEKMDHFAEVTQDFSEVIVKTSTSDVDGLTLLDFQLAIMINSYAEKNNIELVRSGGNFVNEGGWASTATQNTKITPSVIDEAVVILQQFETKFNQWQAQQGLDVEIKMGKPVGSGTYYKRDLAQDPEREYGDVDVMCYIHSREGVGAARRTAEYASAVEEFTKSHPQYSTTNGTNVIMETSAGPVQVDLIYTYHEHADWARMLAPEYRVKGVINTSLVSSLAEVMNLSIGVQGVQVKTRAGRPVSFRQSKDTTLATVSLDPENWGSDVYRYYYRLARGVDPKIPANLAKHSGLKDEQRISDIVLTIKSLAMDLEKANLLGQDALDHVSNAKDLLRQVAQVFGSKLDKVIDSSKFDKASTPAAVEKANKTKIMLAKYKNEITKLLIG